MKVLEDHKAEGIDRTFENVINKEQPLVFKNKSTSYENIADYVELHIIEKSNETKTKETFKLMHKTINNVKRNFIGT